MREARFSSFVKKLLNRRRQRINSDDCSCDRLLGMDHKGEEVGVREEDHVKIRKYHVPMFVGEERKLYYVPLKYMTMSSPDPVLKQLFTAMLENDDLDIRNDGVLTVSCSPEVFDEFLKKAKRLHN